MSDWSGTIPELLFTFVQDSQPTEVEEGMTWFDLGSDRVFVFTDDQGNTREFTVVSHDALASVGPADHHNPVTVADPLTEDGSQGLGLDLGSGLAIDGSGRVYIPADYALSSDLSDHVGDTTNPHNVTDDQTGAAAALSNHENDPDSHHSPPTGTSDAQAGPWRSETVEVSGSITFDEQDKWIDVPSYQITAVTLSGDGATNIDQVEMLDGQTYGGGDAPTDLLYRPVDRVRVNYGSSFNDSGTLSFDIALETLQQEPHSHGVTQ